MFTKSELIKFNFEEEEEWFYYIITKTNDYIDMSIFSKEEWKRLEEMNKKFRSEQITMENLSNTEYNWMFDKTNPEYKTNRDFREAIYYLDGELENNFNIKFMDLKPIDEYKKNLQAKYIELHWDVTSSTKLDIS
jgi:hydroxymethylpyrimidine pyrophosphatase-like HAD family hydrolase